MFWNRTSWDKVDLKENILIEDLLLTVYQRWCINWANTHQSDRVYVKLVSHLKTSCSILHQSVFEKSNFSSFDKFPNLSNSLKHFFKIWFVKYFVSFLRSFRESTRYSILFSINLRFCKLIAEDQISVVNTEIYRLNIENF